MNLRIVQLDDDPRASFPPVMQALARDIRGCPPPWILPDAGHFVQEHGVRIAQTACQHFSNDPVSFDEP